MRIMFFCLLCLTSISLFGCQEEIKLDENQYLIGDDRMIPTIHPNAIITVEIVTDISELNIGDIIAYGSSTRDPNDDGEGDYLKIIWITTTGRIKKIGSFTIGHTVYPYVTLEHENSRFGEVNVDFINIIGRVVEIKNPE